MYSAICTLTYLVRLMHNATLSVNTEQFSLICFFYDTNMLSSIVEY